MAGFGQGACQRERVTDGKWLPGRVFVQVGGRMSGGAQPYRPQVERWDVLAFAQVRRGEWLGWL